MGIIILLLMLAGYALMLWRANPQKERTMARKIYLLERELLRIRAQMKHDGPG